MSAIDPTGHVVWAATPGGRGDRLAADPGRTVYFATLIDTSSLDTAVPLLTGYDEGRGTVRTQVVPRIGRDMTATLAFANGLVYGSQVDVAQGGSGSGGYAVHPDTGALAWNSSIAVTAITPGAVIVINGPEIAALNPTTGTGLWTQTTPSIEGPSPPVAAGNLLYDGEYHGGPAGDTLVARRISDGTTVGSITTSPGATLTDVVPSGGRVFVTTSSQLIAIAPS